MFFVIGPTIASFPFYVLTLDFERVVSYGSVAFSIVVLPTKKRYKKFYERFPFSEILF